MPRLERYDADQLMQRLSEFDAVTARQIASVCQYVLRMTGETNGSGFTCPECGGSYFGTDLVNGVVECHDQFANGCRWRSGGRVE